MPENWCWTCLGNMTEVIGGGTPSSKVTAYYEGGTIPWIRPADLSNYDNIYISHGARNITKLGLEKSSAQMMPPGTVCLSSRAPIGYVVIAQNELCTNQGFKSFLPTPCCLPRYLYWYLKSNKGLLESYASGTTFLELSKSKVELVKFPLPPLAEQQRIVDHIESLFAKLGEAKEKAQTVVDGFELRKSAILHKAFTGELTAQWRKENCIEIDSWTNVVLGELLFPMQTKIPDGEYFRYIDIDSIDNKRQVVGEPKKIRTDNAPSRASRALEDGNILFSMVRPYLKNIAYVDETLADCIASTGFYVCRCKKDILPEFLYEFLCSKDAIDYLMQFMKGDNSPSIRKEDLLGMNIYLPTLKEQKVIARHLQKVLAREQQAKDAAESVLDQIDTMKKSILVRAFRGELGTNDPSEESTVEMLKKVLCEQ